MKTWATYLILSVLLTTSVGAQVRDCVNCEGPDNTSNYLPSASVTEIKYVVDPLVTIETPVLRRNPRAEFCTRNEDAVDTIVFHHSSTGNNASTEDINASHLNNSSANDPWLMIGYHYTINAPYPGVRGETRVSQGRPFNLTGAHAGSDAYRPTSPEVADSLRRPGSILCRVANGPVTAATDSFDRNGNAKANYTTVGVVVIGNYSVANRSNPGGYPRGRIRYPSESAIETAGRLACQLQREHPRINKMSWHSAYKPTACPGTVVNRIEQIKVVARRFGCTFN